MYAAGATAAIAAAAAIANAVKASGSIIELEPEEFLKLLNRTKGGAIVTARGGFIAKDYRYLSVYEGLFIYTKTYEEIRLPSDKEIITAKKICIPG